MNNLPSYFLQGSVSVLGGGTLAFWIDQIFPQPHDITSLSSLALNVMEVGAQIMIDLSLVSIIQQWLNANNQSVEMVPVAASIIIPMSQPNLLRKSINIYNGLSNLFHGAKSPSQLMPSRTVTNAVPPGRESDTSRQRVPDSKQLGNVYGTNLNLGSGLHDQ